MIKIDDSKMQLKGCSNSDEKNELDKNKDDENGEDEEEDEESSASQLLYIFRSASTLRMHLEILYRAVLFLNRKQILAQLDKYREGKERE